MKQSKTPEECSLWQRKALLKYFMEAYHQGYQDGLHTVSLPLSGVTVDVTRPQERGDLFDMSKRPAYHAGFREGVRDREAIRRFFQSLRRGGARNIL